VFTIGPTAFSWSIKLDVFVRLYLRSARLRVGLSLLPVLKYRRNGEYILWKSARTGSLRRTVKCIKTDRDDTTSWWRPASAAVQVRSPPVLPSPGGFRLAHGAKYRSSLPPDRASSGLIRAYAATGQKVLPFGKLVEIVIAFDVLGGKSIRLTSRAKVSTAIAGYVHKNSVLRAIRPYRHSSAGTQ
jgi:hypothetical protein